jgi:hypothetical protein
MNVLYQVSNRAILIVAAILLTSEVARARNNDVFVEAVWKQWVGADEPVTDLVNRVRPIESAMP